jgi:hypothetical protein
MAKNNIFIFVFLLYSALFFSSCDRKEVYYDIADEYLTYYRVGDTLIYKSLDKFDTFVYLGQGFLDDVNNIDDVNIPYKGYEYHYQTVIYKLANGHYPPYLLNAEVSIDYSNSTYIGWQNFKISSFVPNDYSPENIFVNGKPYINVYELNSQSIDTISISIKKIFFCYKYWVVRFIRNDNTIWDLVR